MSAEIYVNKVYIQFVVVCQKFDILHLNAMVMYCYMDYQQCMYKY